MILKYTFAWVPMVFIAIANGAMRQVVYGKYMSELSAHQISCFTGIALFWMYTYFLAGRMPLENSRQAAIVGSIWVVLTIAFEFTFGHYIAKHSWAKLFADYDISAGRLWIMVLATLALMPYAAHRIKTD
jgi:hypothetical protein